MAVKASERVQRYVNANGPTIGTVERKVLSQDGLYFKDIDGTGTVSAVNDWRLSPEERAQAYVKTLTTSEKIGQLFTSDWRMGPKYPSPRLATNGHKPVGDETGLLDEAPVDPSDAHRFPCGVADRLASDADSSKPVYAEYRRDRDLAHRQDT